VSQNEKKGKKKKEHFGKEEEGEGTCGRFAIELDTLHWRGGGGQRRVPEKREKRRTWRSGFFSGRGEKGGKGKKRNGQGPLLWLDHQQGRIR